MIFILGGLAFGFVLRFPKSSVGTIEDKSPALGFNVICFGLENCGQSRSRLMGGAFSDGSAIEALL